MDVNYIGRRRACQDRPSYLEVRGLPATPGYVGTRHRRESERTAA